MSARSRFRWIAALVIALLLSSSAAAVAFWTAQAQLSSTVGTASVGLEQPLPPDPSNTTLNTTYSQSHLVAADTVSVTNTGTREATYTVRVAVDSASGASLAEAVEVSATVMTPGAQCSAESNPSGAQPAPAPLEVTGTIAAGAEVALCVTTSLAASDLEASAGQSAEFSITPKLHYADGSAWNLTGVPVQFTQDVAAEVEPPFVGEELFCTPGSDEPWYLEFKFSQNSQPSSTVYRVFFAPAHDPENRFPVTQRIPTGWDTFVRINWSDSSLHDFVYASGTPAKLGNTWVFVERRVDPSTLWEPAAVGKFHVATNAGDNLQIWCGWQ